GRRSDPKNQGGRTDGTNVADPVALHGQTAVGPHSCRSPHQARDRLRWTGRKARGVVFCESRGQVPIHLEHSIARGMTSANTWRPLPGWPRHQLIGRLQGQGLADGSRRCTSTSAHLGPPQFFRHLTPISACVGEKYVCKTGLINPAFLHDSFTPLVKCGSAPRSTASTWIWPPQQVPWRGEAKTAVPLTAEAAPRGRWIRGDGPATGPQAEWPEQWLQTMQMIHEPSDR